LPSAFGIAALQSFLTRRAPFRSTISTQHVSLFAAATRARIEDPTAPVEARFLDSRRTIP
jgi:hypothetical protein